MKNNNGISLISLIVTIIAIIIIAGISYFEGLDTPKTATRSKFTDEVMSIKTELATVRAKNYMEHDDMNYGFEKVILVDAPTEFISFSGESADVGYLINLEMFGFKPQNRGKAEVTSGSVTFKKDDVYVYDKNGAVYYAKGFQEDDTIYYNSKSFVEEK